MPGVPAQAATMVAPHITEVYSRDGAVDVTFLPANQDRYPTAEWSMTVTSAPGGKTAVVKDRTKTSARVTGLTNGTKYTFTAVESVAGTASPGSVKSEPSVPRVARRPLAPTIDSVFERDGSQVVHWNPGSDRGAPITGYTISAAPSGKKVTVAGDVRTTTLTGLTNGRVQTVSVAATNKIGTGKAVTKGDNVPRPAYAPSKPVPCQRRPPARWGRWTSPGNRRVTTGFAFPSMRLTSAS
ncbi:MAG: fibronectin type III domain-containing protein [Actinomycetota bacterium]|nr:fibronectin type III domain-containing protein [Actinomycetota bacterium]